MWAPPWAAANARRLLTAVGDELAAGGERPLVFFAFSGAIKSVYYQLLLLLAGKGPDASVFSAVRRCACGQGFDSPVDYTSEAGLLLVSPTGPGAVAAATRGALSAAAGALDFAFLELFEKDRAALWSALRHPPFKGPVLLLHGREDGLVDAPRVAGLARALRLSGHPVLEQAWEDSPHVAHAVAHPEEYASCVRWLIRGAEEEWAARAARRQGAQQMAPAADAQIARQQTSGLASLPRGYSAGEGVEGLDPGCWTHWDDDCPPHLERHDQFHHHHFHHVHWHPRQLLYSAQAHDSWQQEWLRHQHHHQSQHQRQQHQQQQHQRQQQQLLQQHQLQQHQLQQHQRQQQEHRRHQQQQPGAEQLDAREAQARQVMEQLGVSRETIDAVTAQIAPQAARSGGGGGGGGTRRGAVAAPGQCVPGRPPQQRPAGVRPAAAAKRATAAAADRSERGAAYAAQRALAAGPSSDWEATVGPSREDNEWAAVLDVAGAALCEELERTGAPPCCEERQHTFAGCCGSCGCPTQGSAALPAVDGEVAVVRAGGWQFVQNVRHARALQTRPSARAVHVICVRSKL